MKTELLIIGSGVAGLTIAVKYAETFPKKNITIVTKGNEDESNTKYAQGGVAVVFSVGFVLIPFGDNCDVFLRKRFGIFYSYS